MLRAQPEKKRRPDNDPRYMRLVAELLDLWSLAGGTLRFSPGTRERPSGPLIRFLLTALAPAYTAGVRRLCEEQLARLIRKERARRSRRSHKPFE